MTTAQFLGLLSVPIAGLVLGLGALWLNREPNPGAPKK